MKAAPLRYTTFSGLLALALPAGADTSDSGAFTIDFVTIGNDAAFNS